MSDKDEDNNKSALPPASDKAGDESAPVKKRRARKSKAKADADAAEAGSGKDADSSGASAPQKPRRLRKPRAKKSPAPETETSEPSAPQEQKSGEPPLSPDIGAAARAPQSDDDWGSYGQIAGADADNEIPQAQADKETAEALSLDPLPVIKRAAPDAAQKAKQAGAKSAGAPSAPALSPEQAAAAAKAAAAQKAKAAMMAILAKFPPNQIFAMAWPRALAFLLIGSLCLIIQTLSMNMFQNNVQYLQGYYHASAEETTWLVSCYLAPYASFTILLTKVRTQVGMRLFTIISMLCFILCCVISLFVHDLADAYVIRFMAGMTTAPISSIGCLYTFEAFAPLKKMTMGVSVNMMFISAGMPLARLMGPFLLEDSHINHFYMIEIGLTLAALSLMHFFRVTPMPQAKVLERLDFVSYPLLAAGLGLNAAMMPVGRFYWWQNAEWMGWCFALAGLCLMLCALIELNRKNPMIDLRWLFSKQMLHVSVVMLTFRILVSDQAGILGNFFSVSGLMNDQLTGLYAMTYLGSVIGCGIACVFLKPKGGDLIYLFGALIIAAGSFSDSFSTNLTRPEQMYISQLLIGAGIAMFMAVSMSKGMLAAVFSGEPQRAIVTFIAAFLFSQCTGGITGSAFFGTIQIYLEKFHSYIITQYLTLTDPIVAGRAAAYGHVYSGVITDKGILQAEGLAMLGKKATIEANILAYNDVFRIYGWIAVALFCLLVIRISYKACLARKTAAAAQPESTQHS